MATGIKQIHINVILIHFMRYLSFCGNRRAGERLLYILSDSVYKSCRPQASLGRQYRALFRFLPVYLKQPASGCVELYLDGGVLVEQYGCQIFYGSELRNRQFFVKYFVVALLQRNPCLSGNIVGHAFQLFLDASAWGTVGVFRLLTLM